MTLADLIAEALSKWGVRHAFGIPSGEVAHLVDALSAHGIEFVLTKHETAAAFMADAHYRLTGTPGVVVAALGAGVSNTVTGAAQAYFDRSPIVFLSGAAPEGTGPLFSRQIFGHGEVYRPFVKWSGRLTPENAAAALRHIAQILLKPRPGPVHLDVPVDLAGREVTPTVPPALVLPHSLPPSPTMVGDVRDRLLHAERAVAILGMEASWPPGAREAAEAFSHTWQIPMFTTYKAKGVVDERGPWAAGPIGLSPVFDGIAQEVVRDADLILTVGLDPIELGPSWLNAWEPGRTVEIARLPGGEAAYASTLTVAVDPVPFLRALADAPNPASLAGAAERVREIRRRQEQVLDRAVIESPGRVSPVESLRALERLLPDDALVTMDTGAFRILATHVLTARHPDQILQSSGLGSMAYGLPAGIAAQIDHPGRPVVVLTGDGGLLMCLGELAVAGERALPLTVVVFVDESLALIELKQERMHLRTEGVRFQAPDFAGLAAPLGGQGHDVTSLPAFHAALTEALSDRSRFHLIAVHVDPAEYRKTM